MNLPTTYNVIKRGGKEVFEVVVSSYDMSSIRKRIEQEKQAIYVFSFENGDENAKRISPGKRLSFLVSSTGCWTERPCQRTPDYAIVGKKEIDEHTLSIIFRDRQAH